jgi:hypothetical protein
MIGPIKTVGVYVTAQKAAVVFCTQKLGFVARRSLPYGKCAIFADPDGNEFGLTSQELA